MQNHEISSNLLKVQVVKIRAGYFPWKIRSYFKNKNKRWILGYLNLKNMVYFIHFSLLPKVTHIAAKIHMSTWNSCSYMGLFSFQWRLLICQEEYLHGLAASLEMNGKAIPEGRFHISGRDPVPRIDQRIRGSTLYPLLVDWLHLSFPHNCRHPSQKLCIPGVMTSPVENLAPVVCEVYTFADKEGYPIDSAEF